MNAEFYINKLGLKRHPEGGYYVQTYRSPEHIAAKSLPDRFNQDRPLSTAIYYLLEANDFSAFHRIKSDECWHFYAGGSLLIHVIERYGKYYSIRLGANIQNGEIFQFVVPALCWFAVEPAPSTTFALTGCTVAPGFDFADFEMAQANSLCDTFPQHHQNIVRLCRS